MSQHNRPIPDHLDSEAAADAPNLAMPLGSLPTGTAVSDARTQIDNPLSRQDNELTRPFQSGGPRAVNLRFLLFVGIATIVVGIGAVFLRDYQMSRLATIYVKRSVAAEDDGDLAKAAKYQQQYLRLRPNDVDARARYVQLLIDSANSTRKRYDASLTMERLLRDDPDQHAIRRQLVDLLMGFDNFSGARAHVDFLLKHSPSSSELFLLKGRCYDAEGSTTHAIAAYKTAIQLEPANLEAYRYLARTLNDNAEEPGEADETMNQMVKNNGGSYPSLLARAQYHLRLGRREMAIIDATRAFQSAPAAIDVMIMIAQLLSEDRQLGENERSNKLAASIDLSSMRDLLKQTIENQPPRTDLLGALASLEWADGRMDAAEKALRQAIAIEPTNAGLTIALFDLLLLKGETETARQELEDQRQHRTISKATATFLEAHLAMKKKEWLEAARMLRSIPLKNFSRTMQNRIGLDLGQCYAELDDAERRLEAIRRAVESDKNSNTSRQQYAIALAGTGRHVEALAQYRQMPQSPVVRVEIARLLLAQQLTLPPQEREWNKVEEAIDQAGQDNVNRGNVALLRAEVLSIQGELQQAEHLLQLTCERLTDNPAVWIGWSRAARENSGADRALEIVAKAEEQLGERDLFLLERIIHWQQKGGETATRELRKLRTKIATKPTAEQDRLLRTLAGAFSTLEQHAESDEILVELIERNPGELSLWLRRFDIALNSQQLDEAQQISAEIRRLDGEEGANWRYAEAMRLANLATQEDEDEAAETLAQARTLLAEIDAQFASSPRVPLALAVIEKQQGNYAAAGTHYVEAIKRGDHRRSVVERAVQRTLQAGRTTDALQILQQYAGRGATSQSRFLGQMEIVASLSSRNLKAAIEIAQAEVKRDPTSANARLILGQILRTAGQVAEAETELRAAWKLAPERPDVVLILVRLLASTNQKDAALAVIKQAEQQLPTDQRFVPLAHCYLVLGKRREAEKYFQLALENQPEDGRVLIATAQFYLTQSNTERAESMLRQVLALNNKTQEAELAAARRLLALLLVGRKNYDDFQSAWSLLEAGDDSNANLHAKAVVLAASPHRNHHRQAVEFLEQLGGRRPLSTAEQRLLTNLYLRLDNWDKARDAMLVLVIGKESDLNLLAYGVRTMFRHNDNGRLPQQWLATLVERVPEYLQTIELRVIDRVLENDVKQAIDLVDQTVAKLSTQNTQRAVVTDRFAKLLGSLGERRELAGRILVAERLFEAAERLHRESIQASPKYLVSLARFLSRRRRNEEAVALLGDIWKTHPAESVAVLCVDILRQGTVGPTETKLIRQQLAAALLTNPDSGILLYHSGNAAQLAGAYTMAINYYERAIQQLPNLATVHNELAMLLSLHADRPQEALELINRAIRIAGPVPAFVDTRSLAYRKLKQSAEAIKQAEQAISDSPSAAYHFHLAQALEAIGEPQAARQEFATALSSGLRADVLHPLERADFAEMQKRFNRPE